MGEETPLNRGEGAIPERVDRGEEDRVIPSDRPHTRGAGASYTQAGPSSLHRPTLVF